ncbi:MAG: hypothetical protein K5838_05935 [Elusimicrobiales bacterium]|nr:hypothetical protein [Elusimicrobiales bacterium]
MKKYIDRKTWDREDIFSYFINYEKPFFVLNADIDVSGAYWQAKEQGESFFILSLHRIMKAVNSIENLRYRLEGENVVLYDTTHAGPTIGRPDGTFGFSFIEYFEDYDKFRNNAKAVIEKVKNMKGLNLTPANDIPNQFYFTAVPWIPLTQIEQPRRGGNGTGAPCVATSKIKHCNGKAIMPVSITAHHSLADGWHASQFLLKAEELMK